MIDPQAEVFKRLASASALLPLLDSYGASASIFAVPAPHDYTVSFAPSILVDYPLGSDDNDTYTEEYRVVDLRVRLYAKPDPSQGGTAKLNLAANEAYQALKTWGPVNLTGGARMISATVSGPVDAPTTDPTNAGRLLNVRLFLKEA
jgi:hypothetical protein